MASKQAFYFSDKSSAETPRELLQRLQTIDTHIAAVHITPTKNDFANWVRAIHKDEALARRIEKCRGVEQVIDELKKSLGEDMPRPPIKIVSTTQVEEQNGKTPTRQNTIPSAGPIQQPSTTLQPSITSLRPRSTLTPTRATPQQENTNAPDKQQAPLSQTKAMQEQYFYKEKAFKEFLYGLLLGIIIGFVISQFIGAI